jgi:hypothetical protein
MIVDPSVDTATQFPTCEVFTHDPPEFDET